MLAIGQYRRIRNPGLLPVAGLAYAAAVLIAPNQALFVSILVAVLAASGLTVSPVRCGTRSDD